MVTYRLRRSRPQVRILAPHPFLLFLLFSLVCCGRGSALEVGDFDYYAAAPETLAASASSTDSLARVVGGDIFGVYWSSFGGNGKITAIDGVDMYNRADGVQELATATYRTFKGVQSEIDAINLSISNSEPLLQQIYDQLYTSSRSGDVVTKTSVADISQRISDSLSSSWSYSHVRPFGSYSPTNFTPSYAEFYYSGSGLLSLLSSFFTHSFASLFDYWSYTLFSVFNFLTPTGDILLSDGTNGTIEYKSVGNVLGNGFSGLATLLGGSPAHRQEAHYVWLGVSGAEQNGPTSLMDMVGEGFLGLAYDLWPDRYDSTQQVLLDFISPDDGVSSQQYEHNNLAQLLAGGFSGLQNPLARLAYVYADQDDIEFKKAETPNLEAVKEDFFGDGQAAVKPSDIKDVAGISSDFKDVFSVPVSVSDFWATLRDGGNYGFFSQQTAEDLNPGVYGSGAAVVSDPDLFEGLVQGDDGLWYFETNPFDLMTYLEGLS